MIQKHVFIKLAFTYQESKILNDKGSSCFKFKSNNINRLCAFLSIFVCLVLFGKLE